MIFTIIILALLAGITYFHYAQGFFSATISAIIAVIAAVMAVSYHEPLALALMGGKAAGYAIAITLVAIFALVYILLRTLTDKAIPGQIRLPVIVDRIGGAAMGLVAAIFTLGIFVLAAQSLPFGPSIGGYSRYALDDPREISVTVPGMRTNQDIPIEEQMLDDTFQPESRKKLIVPVDDIVLGLVQKLSDNGSMAGQRTLHSIHPNYSDELFANRLGIQVGAQQVATNLPNRPQASVTGLFLPTTDLTKTQLDGELPQIHQRPVEVKREPGKDTQLIIRITFHKDAGDSDNRVRLAPASVRLVANGVNYYPVGTLENGLLYANKVDDPLFINVGTQDQAADFVFMVDGADLLVEPPTPKEVKPTKVKDGVFVEVKRLVKIDLSGKEVAAGVKPDKSVQVERKPEVAKNKKGPAAKPDQATPEAASADAPFVFKGVEINKRLFSPINVGTPDKDVKGQTIQSGTLSMQSAQFTELNITPVQSLQVLRQGSYATEELFEPAGMKLVQVSGTPPPEGGDPWAWAQLQNWALVDAGGKTYTPAGAWAKVRQEQADRMIAVYNANGAPPPISGGGDGRPTDVWIAFLVPSGAHLKQLSFNAKPVAQMEQAVQ